MTTKSSPLSALKKQADRVAKVLKAVERGENPIEDVGGKIAAARQKTGVTFAIVMDDKLLKVGMLWSTIAGMSEVAISEWILKHMREQRDAS